jgi:hypothetical protein
MAPTALTPCRPSLGLLIPGPRSTTTPAGATCCAVGSLFGEESYECLDDGSRNGHARLRKISGNCRGAGRMAPRLSFCTHQRSSHGGARQPARPLPKLRLRPAGDFRLQALVKASSEKPVDAPALPANAGSPRGCRTVARLAPPLHPKPQALYTAAVLRDPPERKTPQRGSPDSRVHP